MLLGKDKHAGLLAVFLVFASSAGGQTGKSVTLHTGENIPVFEIKADGSGIGIDYSNSELLLKELTVNNKVYYRISLQGHITATEPGKPELPVLSRLIEIPEGAQYKIRISSVKTTKIKPGSSDIGGLLYPSQDGVTKGNQTRDQVFRFDKQTYASKETLISDTVRIVPLGKLRGRQLANLYISPVSYNPRTNTLVLIKSMHIDITFSSVAMPAVKSLADESFQFSKSLDKGILNFNPDQVIPGFTDSPVTMIIVTDSVYKKHLTPFIKWKTQQGFRLKFIYKGKQYRTNDYQQIKDSILKVYNTVAATSQAPEYLLIIGDTKRIPAFGTGPNGNTTDLYYGEFDGNGDYIPEMYIGRIPAADTTELKSTLSKIIKYESFKFDDSGKFLEKALISAGYDEGYSTNMNGQIKYAISNYLTPQNHISEYHFNYPQSYTAKDSIIKLINTGQSFINYTGHGEAAGWLHVNLKTSDIPLLTNKNMYPFIISNACLTGQYGLSSSFGSRLLLASEKGAIGYIGCSNDSYWDEDFYWAVGPGTISENPAYAATGPGAYDRLFHTHGESPSEWYFTAGQINYAGNLAVSASNSPKKKYYWEIYNFQGDPSMIPYIGKPQALKVVLPDTLPNGIKSFQVNADPFTYVAVSHSDTLWDASFSSISGAAVLDLPSPANDSCLIVITGQNRIPVMKKIIFRQVNKEYVNLTSSGINDKNGNNNKVADFGEAAFLKVVLSNLGLTDTKDLSGKISSTSPWITITRDSVWVGTLRARTDTTIADGFAFTVAPSVPDLGIVTFTLRLKDKTNSKTYSVDITVHAPDLQILNCTLDDSVYGNGDNIPDPGETFDLIFKVRNRGSSNISGNFNINSPGSDITIVDQSIKSGLLKFGEITNIPVQVKISGSASSGSLISVLAKLDCTPYIVNKDFSFRIGKVRESFEASSFSIFPWINLSQAPWVISSSESYDGNMSARSGTITHSKSSSLVIRSYYQTDDSLRFSYKVSSEPNYDVLSFKLNDTEIFKKSGEIPWTRKSVEVKAGLNKMEWIYIKDNSVSQGMDCAWIDMIDFAQGGTVRYIQKDLSVGRITEPVKNEQYGEETISAKVVNIGKETMKGFNLSYSINNNYPPVTEHFNNELEPWGDSVTVSFTTHADMTKYGVYAIKVYGVQNNDDYLFNDTAKVTLEKTKILETVSVYPNPFTDQATVSVNSPLPDHLRLTLTNTAGRIVFSSEKDVITGTNTIILNDLHLSPSIYFLNISGKTVNKTISVVKLKE